MNRKIFITLISIGLLIVILIGIVYILSKNKVKYESLTPQEYLTKYYNMPDIPTASVKARVETSTPTEAPKINFENLEVFIDYPSFALFNPDLADKPYYRTIYVPVKPDGTFDFSGLPAGRTVILIITDHDKIYKQKMVEIPQNDIDIGPINLD